MQDPILNRNLEETKELAIRWSQFHEFFKLGVKGQNITPQSEFKFLELKTRIAMLHDGFLRSVQRDPRIAQNVINVMAACILLRRLSSMSQMDLQKLEYDWNEAYLLMTETISQLEDRRQELLLVSEGAYKLNQWRKRIFRGAGGIARHPVSIVAFVLLIFAMLIAGLPALGVYDIRSIRERMPFTAPVYDPVVGILRKVFTDIPYSSGAEIQVADPRFGQIDRGVGGALADRLAPKDFINQLVNRGFNVNDVDRVTALFNDRLHYDAEIFLDPADGKLICHQVLFASTHDAREFIHLRQAGLDKMGNNDARYRVQQKYTVCRRANLIVLLEDSETGYRREFARKRWGFAPRQIDL